jgi:hypothetical protein
MAGAKTSRVRKSASGRATKSRHARPSAKAKRAPAKRWSQNVTEHSDALDLDRGVFTRGKPIEIARSLKRSAEKSRRRKSSPYRSAMSMLTFYENRAGRTLSPADRKKLENAKDELRRLFQKD